MINMLNWDKLRTVSTPMTFSIHLREEERWFNAVGGHTDWPPLSPPCKEWIDALGPGKECSLKSINKIHPQVIWVLIWILHKTGKN